MSFFVLFLSLVSQMYPQPSMCNIFNLPADTAQWSATLASRLEDQNLCHTEDVVYLLRLNSHDLRMFHARPPRKKLGSLHSPVTVEEESETVCGTHPDHEGSGLSSLLSHWYILQLTMLIIRRQ